MNTSLTLYPVLDEFQSGSLLRHGVDSAEADALEVQSVLLRCPTRAHRHTVVVSKEAVEVGMRTTQQRVHDSEASLLRPVGVELSHNVD